MRLDCLIRQLEKQISSIKKDKPRYVYLARNKAWSIKLYKVTIGYKEDVALGKLG